MITKLQWESYNAYVTERIKHEESFTLSDIHLEELFGITRPFWEDMGKFDLAVERNYIVNGHHFATVDGKPEPTDISFRRRKADE